MNFEQAKAISIVQILEKLELYPIKENEKDAIYFSPLRFEKSASFHVSKKRNVWFDHGIGKGGNAPGLIAEILKAGGYSYRADDVLRWIKNTKLDPSLPSTRDLVKGKRSKWKLIDVMDLEDLALIRYLVARGINVTYAKRFVKEIYVRHIEKPLRVHALGFKNEDGGYEMRNKYFKSAISPKTVTFIRSDKPKPDKVMVFEGFMDFLTYVTLMQGALPCDNVILNSTACVDHAVRYIKNYGYKIAYSWLHNDNAGNAARHCLDEFIKTEPGLVHKPLNGYHSDFKDLNEWHMNRLKLPKL